MGILQPRRFELGLGLDAVTRIAIMTMPIHLSTYLETNCCLKLQSQQDNATYMTATPLQPITLAPPAATTSDVRGFVGAVMRESPPLVEFLLQNMAGASSRQTSDGHKGQANRSPPQLDAGCGLHAVATGHGEHQLLKRERECAKEEAELLA